MRNWMLMKLRHWLRELPDDLVHLNAGIDDIQLYVDKIRDDPQGGRSADFQIRNMYEVASRLRRADIDGKLVFDIPSAEEKSIKSAEEPSDDTDNSGEDDSDHCPTCGGGASYCERCFDRKSKIDPKTDYRVRCKGAEISIGCIDVIEEWQSKVLLDSNFRVHQAIKLLKAAKGNAHSPEHARELLVKAAALIIREIDNGDEAIGRNGDAINPSD